MYDTENKTILDLCMVGFRDLFTYFGEDSKSLWNKYIVDELFKKPEIVDLCRFRHSQEDLWQLFPSGLPGTVLNSICIYTIVRHYNLTRVVETGVANGFYTSFLLSALIENGGTLDSVEIQSDKEQIAKYVPYKDYTRWNLHLGTDSLVFLKENKHYDLYCHDSLHTMSHMTKELNEFKKSDMSKFFCFIDDQDAEDFWNRAKILKLFNKKGYNVKVLDGKSTTLEGHLGGFLKYELQP